MMTTDSERREVARRLRGSMPEGGVFPTGDTSWSRLYRTLFGKYMPIQGAAVTYRQVAERLADLIEPGEPKVRCVAEVKVDYERLERLAHDAVVEATGIDRDALLKLAVNLNARATDLLKMNDLDQSRQRRSARLAHATDLMAACSRIREALGVEND